METKERAVCMVKMTGKLVVIMGVLLLISGLAVCAERKSRTEKGTAPADMNYEEPEGETVNSVSIASSAMERTGCYSFSLDREKDAWFLSIHAVVGNDVNYTERDHLKIRDADAEQILAIVKEQELLDAVLQYEEPETDEDMFVLDETTYNTSFTRADGSRVHAPIDPGKELKDAFFQLAKWYRRWW